MADKAKPDKYENDVDSGPETRDTSQVQVISRAISMLWVLRDHPEGMSLSQLAKETSLARSTVHRIISTLEAERFVAWVGPNGRVRLGLGLATLGTAVSTDLRRELRPYLESLSLEVDETVDLAVLDKDKALFIDQVASPQRLQAVSGIGVTFPLHCTANGKAMLALLPEMELATLLGQGLPAFTPRTKTSREDLMAELALIRTSGLAYDREEHNAGICAIGAAFIAPGERIVAISIPVPSIRFYGNEGRLSSAIEKTALSIRSFFATL
jgi:DNA-binding IclR family transcriptional regulator